MYVKLDKQKMEVVAICGILEDYKPSDEIKEIHSAVSALKLKMEKFMEKILEPELARIQSMIETENKKYVVDKVDIEE